MKFSHLCLFSSLFISLGISAAFAENNPLSLNDKVKILKNKNLSYFIFSSFNVFSMSADGKYLLTRSYPDGDNMIITDAITGNSIRKIHLPNICAFDFTEDSEKIIALNIDGSSIVVNWKTDERTVLPSVFIEPHPDSYGTTVTHMTASKNLKYLNLKYSTQSRQIFNTSNGNTFNFTDAKESFEQMAFNHSETKWAGGFTDGFLRLYDLKTSIEERKLIFPEPIDAIAFSDDDQKIIVLSGHNSFIIEVKTMLTLSQRFYAFKFKNAKINPTNSNEVQVIDYEHAKAYTIDLEAGKIKKEIDIFSTKKTADDSCKFSLDSEKSVCFERNISDQSEFLVEDFRDPKLMLTESKKTLAELVKKEELSIEEKNALFLLFDQLSDTPKNPELKKFYNFAKSVKKSPQNTRAEFLDPENAPLSYYRMILEAAQKLDSSSSTIGLFKPKPEQAIKLLQKFIEDPSATKKDFESLSWLLMKSGAPLDEKVLDILKISDQNLKKDIQEMISTDPYKYKGAASLIGIKLAKTLLAFSEADYECLPFKSEEIGGSSNNADLLKTLNWFTNYSRGADADKIFYAKLIRLLLEKKKVCPTDRHLLINEMTDWRQRNPEVQSEIVASIGLSFQNKKMEDLTFSEILQLAQTVGLRTTLSQAAWLNQVIGFGQLRIHSGGGPLQLSEQETYLGLLKFVLGNPKGTINANQKLLQVTESAENPNSIVKLCRNMVAHLNDSRFLEGTSLFTQYLKEHLDEKRVWPENFKPESSDQKPATLREEFIAKKMTNDLKAIESNCTELPEAPTPKPMPKTKKKKKRRMGDFDPEGR